MTVSDNSKSVHTDTPISRFLAGIRAIMPILMGVIPFAMIIGVVAVDTGLPASMGSAMSLIVYAGAAQFLMMQFLGTGAAWWVIALAAWIINLRFMLYSASLALHLKDLPLKWKVPLAYLISDQGYGVSIIEFDKESGQQHKNWFYFGASLVMWMAFQGGTIIGALLGTQLPESWSLDFAFPLTFTALLIPSIKNRFMVLAAIVSGLIAVAGNSLPYSLNLPLAIGVGIAAGLLSERGFKA
jgi:predicted branched-subunit amino acid permease